MIEAGIDGFEARNWIALFAPTGMSADAINRLNVEINCIVQMPNLCERFTVVGAEPLHGTPRQWADYVRDEVAKWTKVVKAVDIRLE